MLTHRDKEGHPATGGLSHPPAYSPAMADDSALERALAENRRRSEVMAASAMRLQGGMGTVSNMAPPKKSTGKSGSSKKAAAPKKATAAKKARPRELIEPHKGDKRYVRRNAEGEFTKDQVDVGKSLSADARKHSKTVVKKGFGDKGDRPPPKKKR